jgi:hypothetical protein
MTARFASYQRGQAAATAARVLPGGRWRAAMDHSESPARTTTAAFADGAAGTDSTEAAGAGEGVVVGEGDAGGDCGAADDDGAVGDGAVGEAVAVVLADGVVVPAGEGWGALAGGLAVLRAEGQVRSAPPACAAVPALPGGAAAVVVAVVGVPAG